MIQYYQTPQRKRYLIQSILSRKIRLKILLKVAKILCLSSCLDHSWIQHYQHCIGNDPNKVNQ
jgi:hypothetical protein